MKRFVEGADRGQSTLLPECLDEWVEESNSVRVVDCFVDGLDPADLGFEGVEPAATGRPAPNTKTRKMAPSAGPWFRVDERGDDLLHRRQPRGPLRKH